MQSGWQPKCRYVRSILLSTAMPFWRERSFASVPFANPRRIAAASESAAQFAWFARHERATLQRCTISSPHWLPKCPDSPWRTRLRRFTENARAVGRPVNPVQQSRARWPPDVAAVALCLLEAVGTQQPLRKSETNLLYKILASSNELHIPRTLQINVSSVIPKIVSGRLNMFRGFLRAP